MKNGICIWTKWMTTLKQIITLPTAKKYYVFFNNQCKKYRVGKKVELDVSNYAYSRGARYNFFMDRQHLKYQKTNKYQAALLFVMPNHDVNITFIKESHATVFK
jgi:hypothetical protein